MAHEEHFEDVADLVGGLSGIFGGEGYSSLNRVTHKMAKDGSGYVFSLQCVGCGQPTEVHVSWDELIYCMARKKPIEPNTRMEWIYDPSRGGVHPPGTTRCCQSIVPMLLNAQEAARYVEQGVQARRLPPQYVAKMLQGLGVK